MERRKTQLEEKLLSNGWYLESKDYAGKYSQKTLSYTYSKDLVYGNGVVNARVIINAKRDEIIDIQVKNPYKQEIITRSQVEAMDILLDFVNEEVEKALNNEENR